MLLILCAFQLVKTINAAASPRLRPCGALPMAAPPPSPWLPAPAWLTRPGRPPDDREGAALRSPVRPPGRGLTRGVVGWGPGAAAPLLPVTRYPLWD